MAIHEISMGINRRCLHWFNEMVTQGVINDAAVAGITTGVGAPGTNATTTLRGIALQGATGQAAIQETGRRFYELYQKAIDDGHAAGCFGAPGSAADTAINALTTVAGFRAMMVANDPSGITVGTEQLSLVA